MLMAMAMMMMIATTRITTYQWLRAPYAPHVGVASGLAAHQQQPGPSCALPNLTRNSWFFFFEEVYSQGLQLQATRITSRGRMIGTLYCVSVKRGDQIVGSFGLFRVQGATGAPRLGIIRLGGVLVGRNVHSKTCTLYSRFFPTLPKWRRVAWSGHHQGRST